MDTRPPETPLEYSFNIPLYTLLIYTPLSQIKPIAISKVTSKSSQRLSQKQDQIDSQIHSPAHVNHTYSNDTTYIRFS